MISFDIQYLEVFLVLGQTDNDTNRQATSRSYLENLRMSQRDEGSFIYTMLDFFAFIGQLTKLRMWLLIY